MDWTMYEHYRKAKSIIIRKQNLIIHRLRGMECHGHFKTMLHVPPLEEEFCLKI